MNRRSFLKKFLGSIFIAGTFSTSTYYYARAIEPKRLSFSEHHIASPKIPNSFNDFKIIHFSDTHIGFNYSLSRLEKLVERINHLNPDLIVFTGDLIDQPENFYHKEPLVKILKTLKAPYGKYWVYGNHDHGGYGTELLREIMDQSNFSLLKNEYTYIEKDQDKIVLSGVDDLILGSPNLKEALPEKSNNIFTILLAHEPDYADTSSQFPVDVQLSGHSHGGQVRLPILGHLYTPIFAEKYIQGKYALNNGEFLLFVNRGIGTTRLPVRLFCSPELSLYLLKGL